MKQGIKTNSGEVKTMKIAKAEMKEVVLGDAFGGN
jgi:hypothetical protein